MKLRPYQRDAVAAIFRELEQCRSTLVVLPTGCGKTVVFGEAASRWPAGRVLVVAHREELIAQAATAVESITGERPAVEMGELRDDDSLYGDRTRVLVTSVQTMSRPNRLARFQPEDFGLVVIDEAHHAVAQTYRRVLDHFLRHPACRVLGVTATPDRGDEAALGQVFDSVACNYEILNAVRDGWLVPIEQKFVACKDLDFSRVKTTCGDLNESQLAAVMEEEAPLHQVAVPTVELAGDRPCIVFCVRVAHAERVAEIINRHRPGSALCLHGKVDAQERRRLLGRFHAGEYQFLINADLFLEGFDCPRLAVAAIAKPTTSRARYAQMVGRVTRSLPGVINEFNAELEAIDRHEAICISSKPACEVLDFVGNSGQHKLVCTADLLGGEFTDDVVCRARERAVQKSARGEAVDMQKELFEAAKEVEDEARRRRRAVVGRARYHVQQVDPFDVFDVTPRREPGWYKGKGATEAQKAVLTKAGIGTEGLSLFAASQLIDQLVTRREKGQCTFKQAKILQKHGYDTSVSFEEASRIIDLLAKNGWKRPAGAAA